MSLLTLTINGLFLEPPRPPFNKRLGTFFSIFIFPQKRFQYFSTPLPPPPKKKGEKQTRIYGCPSSLLLWPYLQVIHCMGLVSAMPCRSSPKGKVVPSVWRGQGQCPLLLVVNFHLKQNILIGQLCTAWATLHWCL